MLKSEKGSGMFARQVIALADCFFYIKNIYLAGSGACSVASYQRDASK
jgi:hypothetical protein